MDLILNIITRTTSEEDALITNPVIALAMSKDSDSQDSEYITIQQTGFTVGTTSSNVSSFDFAVGSELFLPAGGSTNSINFDGNGNVGSAEFWQFNQNKSF